MVDALAAVEASRKWSSLPPETMLSNKSAVSMVIPEIEYRSVQSTIEITDQCDFEVESVDAHLHVDHESQ